MHVAASWGSADVVHLLLEKGAELHLRDADGLNAFELVSIIKYVVLLTYC